MVHYTCDMCGKPLLADEDTRYVVKVEVFVADNVEDDLDEEIGDEEEFEFRDGIIDSEEVLENREYKTFRFDLCAKCHKHYLQDPLSVKSGQRTRFSQN